MIAETGALSQDQLAEGLRQGLAGVAVDGQRVLLVIPDGTRTMPMAFVFDVIDRELDARVAALDVLVALGTHAPMSDEQLSRHLGWPVVNGRAGRHRVYNHRWDAPETFLHLGTIPAAEVRDITTGRLDQDVDVSLNRLVTEYDHILICGPVFPHEVVGFSGGTKYLFPGIAAPPIIHFTHWLGALITSYDVIGTMDTPVRAIIDRAASMLETPVSLIAVVATHDAVAGVFIGNVHDAWRQAATLSSARHITWLDTPVRRVLAVMPAMYDDLWTAAKGMYKAEPAVEDGGEVIIYAPHITEVSYVHGKLIDAIGYHCRDYFVKQWTRFKDYPGGILAHSTHVKGLGTYEAATAHESPRITVTLATGIPRERCERINLGYQDPGAIDPATWASSAGPRTLVIPYAGEQLFRVKPVAAGRPR